MKIYIVRHGETDANRKGELQGWRDLPLNENGIRLAEVTGEALKGITFDACFSSPLQRAVQTAELILRRSGNGSVPVRTDPRLREIHLGDWEGKRFRGEAPEVDPEKIRLFFSDPFLLGRIPGGEEAREVCKRTQAFLRELAEKAVRNPGEAPETVLVAIHGFALRAMLNFLYEDPEDFWHGHVPYNCAVDLLEADEEGIRFAAGEKIYYDREDQKDFYAKQAMTRREEAGPASENTAG